MPGKKRLFDSDDSSDSSQSSGEESVPRKKRDIDAEIQRRTALCQGLFVCTLCSELVKEGSLRDHGMEAHSLEEVPVDPSKMSRKDLFFNIDKHRREARRDMINNTKGLYFDKFKNSIGQMEVDLSPTKPEDEKSLNVYIEKCRSLIYYADFASLKETDSTTTDREEEADTLKSPEPTPLRSRPFTMRKLNANFLSENMLELVKDFEGSLLELNKQYRVRHLRSSVIILTLFTPVNDAKSFKFEHLGNLCSVGDSDSIYYLEKRIESVASSKSDTIQHLKLFLKFLSYLLHSEIEDIKTLKTEFLSEKYYEIFDTFSNVIHSLRLQLQGLPCLDGQSERMQSQPLDHMLILHSPLMINFVQEFQDGKKDDIIESACAKNFFTSLVLTRLYILQGQGNGSLLKLTVNDFESPVTKDKDFVTLKISGLKDAYVHLHECEFKMVSYYLEFIRPHLSPKNDKEGSLFLTKCGKCIDTYCMNLKFQTVSKVALESYRGSKLFKGKLSNRHLNQRIDLAKKRRYSVRSMRISLHDSVILYAAIQKGVLVSTVKYQHLLGLQFNRRITMEESRCEVRAIRKYFLPTIEPCSFQKRTEMCTTMLQFVTADQVFRMNLSRELWNGLRLILELTADKSERDRFKQLTLAFEENLT